jgi:hypothetical protein
LLVWNDGLGNPAILLRFCCANRHCSVKSIKFFHGK